jgi:alpha/beta superfamily hydrolase
MRQPPVVEEVVRFGRDDRLAGVLHYPAEGEPDHAVLLFSPHPNFAGDLDNNVIQALARSLSADAVVLRFDYRGIGQSRIGLPDELSVFDYWEEVEEKRDYTDALADAVEAADELWRIAGNLPMVAVGYSFGAIIGTRTALGDDRFIAMAGIAPPLQRIGFEFLADCPKPCLMLSGSDDFVYDAPVAALLIAAAGRQLTFDRIQGMDHFFRDNESLAAERVDRFVRQVRSTNGD